MNSLDINGRHSQDVRGEITMNVGFYRFGSIESFAEPYDAISCLYL